MQKCHVKNKLAFNAYTMLHVNVRAFLLLHCAQHNKCVASFHAKSEQLFLHRYKIKKISKVATMFLSNNDASLSRRGYIYVRLANFHRQNLVIPMEIQNSHGRICKNSNDANHAEMYDF